MVFRERNYKMGSMKKLQSDTVGMHLIDFQIICFLNCKDIQIIMKMLLNHIKLLFLLMILLTFLMDIA